MTLANVAIYLMLIVFVFVIARRMAGRPAGPNLLGR